MNPERTFLEFFAGIGLIRWALQRKGWQCVFSNDIDERKRAIYQENFGGDNFILADVNQLKADQVPGALLATAGFPCTDLSLAGARRGLKGSESSAFWGFTKTLDLMGNRRPPLILIENVPGFLTSHDGRDFRAAVAELNRLGYRCDAFMVDASHFVPQSRVRLFIVGALSKPEVMIPLSDTILYAESECRPPILTKAIDANRDLKWSLQLLPSLPVTQVTLRDVLEALPDEHPAWWSRERVDHLLSQITGGGPARGVLSSTLVILDRLSRDFDLNLDAHLTPNKGQIKGASGKASSKILARFGESRPFPVEGGRTNRGNIKTAESLLSPLAESGIGRLSKEERNLRPDQNH